MDVAERPSVARGSITYRCQSQRDYHGIPPFSDYAGLVRPSWQSCLYRDNLGFCGREYNNGAIL